MCMIKVRPEADEEEVSVPARLVEHNNHRRTTGGSRSRDSRIQETTIVETVKAPPPPPSRLSLDQNRGTTTIIQAPDPPASIIGSEMARHGHAYDSPRASVVSTRSRDYYVDSSAYAGRSPRSSYRYVDAARGSGRVDGGGGVGLGGVGGKRELDYVRGDRYGYNNYHGRRSGSVSYVNPRHSTASHRSARSMREKVVVVDEYGREKFY